MSAQVLVIRTGAANLASVLAAFTRLGAPARVTDDPAEVRDAPAVVLPGVGAFGPAMRALRARGLDAAVVARAQGQRPLLAVCLGLQLLCDASDESPAVPGLGVMPAVVRRFGGVARVPHMGWNELTPTPDAVLLRAGTMYFANSYRLERLPAGWAGATTDYAGQFVSALERGALLACQFHPELSGRAGLGLLRRWLERAGVVPTPAPGEPAPC